MRGLHEISDRLDIDDLIYAYAAALDTRDSEAFRCAFTEDARLLSFAPGDDEPYMVRVGGEQLATIADGLARFSQTMHVISNRRVEIDGNSARGVVYCVAHHVRERDGAREDVVLAIHYHDNYRRTDAGWRIRERAVRMQWNEVRPITNGLAL